MSRVINHCEGIGTQGKAAGGGYDAALQAEYQRMLSAAPLGGIAPPTLKPLRVALPAAVLPDFSAARVAQAKGYAIARRSRLRRGSWRTALAAGLIFAGCTGLSFATRDVSRPSVHPVEGSVRFQGAIPVGATVTLHPLDAAVAVRPRGFVGADGNFRLTTYLPEDGAPRGEYRVTFEWNKPVVQPNREYAPGPNLLPAALSRPETSPYRATVGRGTNQLAQFDVAR